jgi:TPR repeat protein
LRATQLKLPGMICVSILLGVLPVADARADFPQAYKQYAAGDYEGARVEFLALAALGDAASQFNLGAMAMQGQGGPKDPGAAVGWLAAAADNGDRRLAPEKLAGMRAKLSEEQRKAADAIFSRYSHAALLQTVLPVPGFMAHCNDLVPAQPVRLASGSYPYHDRLKDQNGFVILELTIGVDGIPRDPEILMAVPSVDFSGAAIEVWLHSRFEPAKRGGQPVESKLPVKTKFQITGGGSMWDVGALKTMRETALTGEPSAQYQIGLAATLDPSLGVSASQSYTLLVSAAQGGNPAAQYWAASRFISLQSCDSDGKKLPWLRAAAESREPAAQLRLALDLLAGQSSAEQLTEARSLLKQAAQSDNFYVEKHVTALMASSPIEAIRDAATAAAAARKLLRSPVQSDPQMFEAIAAADAANGDFASAIARQQTAIKKAADLGWNTQPMEERLGAYRLSRAWVGDLFIVPAMPGSR